MSLRAALGVPVARLLDLTSRCSARQAGVVICHHRVDDPQEDPDAYLVAAMGTKLFEAQLRHLKRRYRVVPPSEILDAVRARRRGQRFPVAITFDDDLPTHLPTAVPIMKRMGVPAAFFLTGASMEEPSPFWWEQLDVALNRPSLSEEELRDWLSLPSPSERPMHIYEVTAVIEDLPPRDRDRFASRLDERVGQDPRNPGMRAAEVRELAGEGFEIGFHTAGHYSLPTLDGGQLSEELERGRAELEAEVGGKLNSIAYPHGKADRRVGDAARAAGFRQGFAIRHEPVVTDTDSMLIPRLYPIYDSLGHFALRIARVIRSRDET